MTRAFQSQPSFSPGGQIIRASAGMIAVAIATGVPAPPAGAIVLGGCPSPIRPPPCLVFDGQKAITVGTETATRQQQVAAERQTTGEWRSAGAAMGTGPARVALPTAYVPLAPTAGHDGRSQVAAAGQSPPTARRFLRERALDSHALATAMKARLAALATEADSIRATIAVLPGDARTDMELNSRARMLWHKIRLARAELLSQRLALASAPLGLAAANPATTRPIPNPATR